MNDSYPNLMCFGKDITNCPLLGKCPDYRACEEQYRESWLRLFDSAEETET